MEPPPLPDPESSLKRALSRPLCMPPLVEFFEPQDRVAIVVPPDHAALQLVIRGVEEVAQEADAKTFRHSLLWHETLGLNYGAAKPTSIDQAVAQSDRVVLIGSLNEPLDLEAIAPLLTLLPPLFSVLVALQRGQKLAAIFAGDLSAATARARKFQQKWLTRTD